MTSSASHIAGEAETLTVLQRLRKLADDRPRDLALRQKQRGSWYQWRWRDVADEVRRLAAGLRLIGFTASDRLAVIGDYGPHSLLLGLAAQQIGGAALAVATTAGIDTVTDLLANRHVRYAFLQDRQKVALWRQIGAQHDIDPYVIIDHAPAGGNTADLRLVAFDSLRALGHVRGKGGTTEPSLGGRQAFATPTDLTWVEESTDWQAGLDVLLQDWLAGELALAFPESLSAAERDRRELQPARLLASAERLTALHHGIIDRLPAAGTWPRRAIDWAVQSGGAFRGHWVSGLVVHLLRRALGFRQLREIVTYTAGGATDLRELPGDTRRFFVGLAVFLLPQLTVSTPRGCGRRASPDLLQDPLAAPLFANG